MSGIRLALLGSRAQLEQRHAALLRPNMVRRAGVALTVALVSIGLLASLWYVGLSPTVIARGLRRLGSVVGLMLPPNPQNWANAGFYVRALAQTVAMAFVGTLGAAVLALPLAFLAARNVVGNWLIHILSRRFCDTVRGVDPLIWALIWINVVGLGPFAGVLAIITTDVGVYGKLLSEAIETADRKPTEGVLAAGGSAGQSVRFSLIPQLLPVVLSQLLYYFESNTREASVLGIVGAGGIGLPLSEMIRTDEWQQVSFIVLLLLAAVAVIDWGSSRLRLALIGRRR